jgi:hypothetical protein
MPGRGHGESSGQRREQPHRAGNQRSGLGRQHDGVLRVTEVKPRALDLVLRRSRNHSNVLFRHNIQRVGMYWGEIAGLQKGLEQR